MVRKDGYMYKNVSNHRGKVNCNIKYKAVELCFAMMSSTYIDIGHML